MLEKINSPKDLKLLKIEELPELVKEIREVLINKIYTTGGHLGSNLAMIETTVALHYVFDSPKDKFVSSILFVTAFLMLALTPTIGYLFIIFGFRKIF